MSSPFDPDLYERVLFFVAEAHEGQRFPGKELPYLVHLLHVTGEIQAALAREPGWNANLALQCAMLHDCVEDRGIAVEELARRFGADVAAGVLALSKDEALPKHERMADSLRRIREQPKEVWMVKLADRTANLAEPPYYWPLAKRQAYREEGRLIHATLHEASPYLATRLAQRIAEYGRYCEEPA